jgi:hypothetical protein
MARCRTSTPCGPRSRGVRGGGGLDGDAAFAIRWDFFTELRDPLVTPYGDEPGFPEHSEALLAVIAATAAAREPALRRVDHEGEVTSDWL